MMKKILVFFYDWEINSDSTNSMARILASVINEVEDIYQVVFFSFKSEYADEKIITKPRKLVIKKSERVKQKFTNLFYDKKHIKEFHLRQKFARKFLLKEKKNYDAIIVLGLDEVNFLRTNFPSAKIIYWIHGISAIYKEEYLQHFNKIDYLWSPTKIIYKQIINKLHPTPFFGEFQLIPNWAEDGFDVVDEHKIAAIKKQHNILEKEKVFIFCGGEIKLKGLFLIKKIFRNFFSVQEFNICVIITGGNKNDDFQISPNTRIIFAGTMPPKILAVYYRAATYGLFPSLGGYEHAPLTLLEMIKCNVLPIASDVGGIKELVNKNYRFLVEAPHSIKDWQEKVYDILNLEDERRTALISDLKKHLENYQRVDAVSILKQILE